MKKVIASLFVFLILAEVTFTQPPDTLWTRTYGGNSPDEFYDMAITSDGGIICVGGTYSFGEGNIDMWVVKTDSSGNLAWSRTFGGIYDDRAEAVLENPDGTLMIAGHLSGDTSRYEDGALLKLTAEGDSLWGQTYGGRGDDLVFSLISTEDSGYIMAGFSDRSFGNSVGRDYWVIRVNQDGDSLWSRLYGSTRGEGATTILATNDGGFVISGDGQPFTHNPDMWLLKIDADGDSLWSQTYGGNGLEENMNMSAANDGGFILVGYTHSYGEGFENGYIVKTDSLGNTQWERAYGQDLQARFQDALQLQDGSYVVCGSYSYSAGNGRAWLIKLSAEGDSLWSRQWGQAQTLNGFNAIERVTDGSYLLAGSVNYRLDGHSGDGWLLKTGEDPLAVVQPSIPLPENLSLEIYPNPFNSSARISLELPLHLNQAKLSIYNLLGQKVLEKDLQVQNGRAEYLWNAAEMSTGIYLAKAEAGENIAVEKIMLLK